MVVMAKCHCQVICLVARWARRARGLKKEPVLQASAVPRQRTGGMQTPHGFRCMLSRPASS
eukprot:5908306-Amphidinium_carterae.3